MSKRPKHPDKDIEAALRRIETMGWRVEPAKGRSAHCWGFVTCPANAPDSCRNGTFCRMSVWSTPRVPHHHARDLLRKATACMVEGDSHEH